MSDIPTCKVCGSPLGGLFRKEFNVEWNDDGQMVDTTRMVGGQNYWVKLSMRDTVFWAKYELLICVKCGTISAVPTGMIELCTEDLVDSAEDE